MSGNAASKDCSLWRLDSNAALVPPTKQERSDARRKYNELATAEGLLGSIRLRLLGREITLCQKEKKKKKKNKKASGSMGEDEEDEEEEEELFPLPLPSPFSLLLRPPVFLEATDVDGCEMRPVRLESVVYKALHDLCERDWKRSTTESGDGTETIFMQQDEEGEEEETVGTSLDNRFMGNMEPAKQDPRCGGGVGLGLLDELSKDGMMLLEGDDDDEEGEEEDEEEEEVVDSDCDDAEEDEEDEEQTAN